jgi:L-rhamnose mutarotase
MRSDASRVQSGGRSRGTEGLALAGRAKRRHRVGDIPAARVTLLAGSVAPGREKSMTRYGAVLGIRPEHIAEYKRLHAAVWPDVLKQIRASQITNYTIFLREPENLLFSYYEYTGTDHDADMARMAADPRTQEWWALCGPMQRRFDSNATGEWWGPMEEVFHSD